MLSTLLARPTLALTVIASWPAGASGQFDEPPGPAAYGLRNVTVLSADGSRVEGVNVVVRNGAIEALGANVVLPIDAKVLDGDSLWVYPGIVDAHGAAVFEFPTIDRSGNTPPWDPPRDVQGFLPARRVADFLTVVGKDLAPQRRKGVVAAAVHPDDPLMPGQSVLIMHRGTATTSDELIVTPSLGPVMTFRGSGSGYPGTLFAVIAFYRQQFENARHYQLEREAFAREPRGLRPPRWDRAYDVLLESMAGGPVYFEADIARDIARALALAADHGFRLIVVGGDEAWKVADDLKAADVPVLVSLDFPKPKRWKPRKPAEEATPPDTAETEPQEPQDAAERREQQRLEDIYANPARLAAAGVRFALTSGGGKAEILEASRKAIEYGLPRASALAALTAVPAEILGIPYVAQIEPGLPATFIVTNGDLFDAATKIVYTFVEGDPELGDSRTKTDEGEAPTASLAGTWAITVDAEGEAINAIMRVTQSGATIEGTLETPFGNGTFVGEVTGQSVSIDATITAGGESMDFTLSGAVEGETASGSGSAPDGSFTWTARRTGPGEEVMR